MTFMFFNQYKLWSFIILLTSLLLPSSIRNYIWKLSFSSILSLFSSFVSTSLYLFLFLLFFFNYSICNNILSSPFNQFLKLFLPNKIYIWFYLFPSNFLHKICYFFLNKLFPTLYNIEGFSFFEYEEENENENHSFSLNHTFSFIELFFLFCPIILLLLILFITIFSFSLYSSIYVKFCLFYFSCICCFGLSITFEDVFVCFHSVSFYSLFFGLTVLIDRFSFIFISFNLPSIIEINLWSILDFAIGILYIKYLIGSVVCFLGYRHYLQNWEIYYLLSQIIFFLTFSIFTLVNGTIFCLTTSRIWSCYINPLFSLFYNYSSWKYLLESPPSLTISFLWIPNFLNFLNTNLFLVIFFIILIFFFFWFCYFTVDKSIPFSSGTSIHYFIGVFSLIIGWIYKITICFKTLFSSSMLITTLSWIIFYLIHFPSLNTSIHYSNSNVALKHRIIVLFFLILNFLAITHNIIDNSSYFYKTDLISCLVISIGSVFILLNHSPLVNKEF